MRKRIEKKLGCTIEEYFDKRAVMFGKYLGEVDCEDNPLTELDYDELDYITDYVMKKRLKIQESQK